MHRLKPLSRSTKQDHGGNQWCVSLSSRENRCKCRSGVIVTSVLWDSPWGKELHRPVLQYLTSFSRCCRLCILPWRQKCQWSLTSGTIGTCSWSITQSRSVVLVNFLIEDSVIIWGLILGHISLTQHGLKMTAEMKTNRIICVCLIHFSLWDTRVVLWRAQT